jgi:hypothetical protein
MDYCAVRASRRKRQVDAPTLPRHTFFPIHPAPTVTAKASHKTHQ